MRVVETIAECRKELSKLRQFGGRTGFVPTMGALHAGHVSLMEICRPQVEISVASIFVNPTQFAPTEDLSRYPRPLEHDLELCRASGVDLVFVPTVAEMYPPLAQTTVSVSTLTTLWEGQLRPTHFQGVTTVVTKLFNIVQPQVAFFGQKDYQQQAILRRMVQDLDQPVKIRTCSTIRESDGLAMSSRNAYLTSEQRSQATQIYRGLAKSENLWQAGERSPAVLEHAIKTTIAEVPALDIDYVAIVDPETLKPLDVIDAGAVALVACRLGTTRLIDNLLLGNARQIIESD